MAQYREGGRGQKFTEEIGEELVGCEKRYVIQFQFVLAESP